MRIHLCNLTVVIMVIVMVLSACTTVPSSTPTIQPTSTFFPTLSAPTPEPEILKLSKPPELILANNKPFEQTGWLDVIYTLPETDKVLLASELTFYNDLKVDIYYPSNYHFESKLPVVIFSIGFPDSVAGFDKDITSFIDWAKLIAASGMIGVTAQAGSTPDITLIHLLEFLAANTDQLGVDMTHIGFMAWSSQGYPAFAALADKNLPYRSGFRAAAFIYLDFTSSDPSQWPEKFSLIVVKAGKDTNVSGTRMDSFVEEARKSNLPTEYIELPNALHGFDTMQNSQEYKDVIVKILEFFKTTLLK